ncbi:MAG: penicillin-binding transpeptidase domain-containing protein [Actinoallomurus sp.]
MRNKKLWLIVAVVAVVLLGVAGGGAYVLLRTKGSPGQTAEDFLAGWRRGDLAAMRATTVTPPGDFDKYYQGLRTDLGATKVDVSLGTVTKHGTQAAAPFTATLTLPAGTWKYQGSLRLVTSNRKWKVAWTPEAVHPGLHAGQHFATSYRWLKRGSVLAADGTPIDGPTVSGSVQQLVGTTAPLTDKQAKKLGTPYAKGDVVGQSGIQQRFDQRLAGTPTTTISTADASGHVVKAVTGFVGRPGQSVKTSLDLHVQQAISNALQGQAKPTSMVAMRPATGQILGVGNIPGGWDRAMQGTYAPGSTFKVVTAYALLEAGLSPSASVQCPKTANVGGQTIHNSEGEGGAGSMTFKDALAQSCNTAFALQTQKLLTAAKLTSAASALGFNQKIDPGVTATAGSFPTPTSDAEKAVAGFGQGRDLANALSIAGVAAGVADGTWRPPVVVTEPQVPQKAKPTRLNAAARSQLEEMMRAVVTSGTAKPAGLPSGTAGKTGTAEYGSAQKGKMPPTHAWFMGFRGDVAFAVVVEGGGFGAKAAAPIAARFLKAL